MEYTKYTLIMIVHSRVLLVIMLFDIVNAIVLPQIGYFVHIMQISSLLSVHHHQLGATRISILPELPLYPPLYQRGRGRNVRTR